MPRTIVLIDDEDDLIAMLTASLEMRGYEVHSATTGDKGLKLVEKEKPDAIICDLMMPGMSGLEVCKKLRSDDKTKAIPIVVISALGSQSDRPEEFWAAGLKSDDFISKPFETEELLGRLEYVLRRDDYVSTKNAKKASEPPPVDLSNASPREVVREFVESWNREDFAAEYACMDDTLTGGLNRNEYIARRRQVFSEQGNHPRKHVLEKVINEDRSEDEVTITARRSEKTDNHSREEDFVYRLKKTDSGWKVVGVQPLAANSQS